MATIENIDLTVDEPDSGVQRPDLEINLECILVQSLASAGSVGKFVPLGEVFEKLRSMYARIFERQADAINPKGETRLTMIRSLRDVAGLSKIEQRRFIIYRHKKDWRGLLKKASSDLSQELDRASKRYQKSETDRDSDQEDLEQLLERFLEEAEHRAQVVKKDSELAERIILDLMELDKRMQVQL